MRARILAGLLCLGLGLLLAVPAALGQGGTVSSSFMETFTGRPTAPAAYRPPGWDVDIHSRDPQTWDQIETVDLFGGPVMADHGPGCQGPPLQHAPPGAYPPHVFQCSDHLMTTIQANGYGVIYLTPPALLDWSQGEATLRFDMSTNRTSIRDWVDVWLTPYDQATKLPLEDSFPVDLAGAPLTNVHLMMGAFNGLTTWNLTETHDGVVTPLGPPWGFTWPSVEGAVAAVGTSASRRDTFELKLSNTHVGFTMPAYPDTAGWIDTPLTAPLPFTQALVQFGHHSYFPQKGCEGLPDDARCPANTWHWDNVSLSPAMPIQITQAAGPRMHSQTSGTDTWTFPAAVADQTLKFSAVSSTAAGAVSIDLSWDNGATWATYLPVPTGAPGNPQNHARGYSVAPPLGATSVRVRGDAGVYGEGWHAKDAAIYTPYDPDAGGPPATPTPVPAATATVVAATLTAVASVTPVAATATPVPTEPPLPTVTPGATQTAVPTRTPLPQATATPAAGCAVSVQRAGQVVATWPCD